MELFDQQILDVRKFIARMRKETKRIHEIICTGSAESLMKSLAVTFDPENQPFVVFKEDTFVELGSPLKGSCSMFLWTQQPKWIEDGKITVIGPDIPESKGASLPFAQVIMVGADRLKEADLVKLERTSDLAHHLEGYMIRRMPGKIWSRVSNGAGKKGFSFETLGAALIAHYRMNFTEVDAIEILFVTESKPEVTRLEEISRDAKDKSLSIRKLVRSANGTYECNDLNCSVCPDQEACQTIRDVIVIRKGGKVAKIKVVRGREKKAAS